MPFFTREAGCLFPKRVYGGEFETEIFAAEIAGIINVSHLDLPRSSRRDPVAESAAFGECSEGSIKSHRHGRMNEKHGEITGRRS